MTPEPRWRTLHIDEAAARRKFDALTASIDDLERLRHEHAGHLTTTGRLICPACGTPWPCTTTRLVHAITHQETR